MVDVTRTHTAAGDRRNVAVGAEQWLWQSFGLRAGLRVSLIDEARPVGAVGAGWAVGSGVGIDGQITSGLPHGDRGCGISGRVGF